jgi:hypothetical protein
MYQIKSSKFSYEHSHDLHFIRENDPKNKVVLLLHVMYLKQYLYEDTIKQLIFYLIHL